MVHFCFSEELEQVSSGHELHDDVDRIVVDTHSQYLHDVGVVEVSTGRGGRQGRERGGREGEGESEALFLSCDNEPMIYWLSKLQLYMKTHAMSAASDKNFVCSSGVAPLRNVCCKDREEVRRGKRSGEAEVQSFYPLNTHLYCNRCWTSVHTQYVSSCSLEHLSKFTTINEAREKQLTPAPKIKRIETYFSNLRLLRGNLFRRLSSSSVHT
jgi:hypothetical protein